MDLRYQQSGKRLRNGSITGFLLGVARLGLAHEFFGHVFEVVTKVPERYAIQPRPGQPDDRLPSLTSPGSPLRYFAPVAPVTTTATVGALVASRRSPGTRRWLAASAIGLLSADALTAYIVRALNVPLFVAGHPLTPADRSALLRTWHRLTAARIILYASASLTAAIAHDRHRTERAG